MKTRKFKTGLTLLEMLVVLAIITLLAAMVVGIAARIDNQGKEHLTKGTLALLNGALGQFRDYSYTYKGSFANAGLNFPLDCNGFGDPNVGAILTTALGTPVFVSGSSDANSGSQVLYFLLSRVFETRGPLDEIRDMYEKSITSDGFIKIGRKEHPLLTIKDPWKKALRYDYYDELETDPARLDNTKKTFPVITSAGPDGLFGTDDDITNR